MIDKIQKEKIVSMFGERMLRVFEPLIYSDMEILSWKKGDVRLKLPVSKDMLNPYGRLHGGMTYTLCDMSTGITAASLGLAITTLQGSINYIKSVEEGFLTTRNKVIHNGKSTVVANVEVINEEEELIANGVFTMFVMDTYDID